MVLVFEEGKLSGLEEDDDRSSVLEVVVVVVFFLPSPFVFLVLLDCMRSCLGSLRSRILCGFRTKLNVT